MSRKQQDYVEVLLSRGKKVVFCFVFLTALGNIGLKNEMCFLLSPKQNPT